MPHSRPTIVVPCVVCGSSMRPWLEADLWRCPSCGHRCSTFASNVTGEANASLVEAKRFSALAALRQRTCQTILDLLAARRDLAGARLCDVGCAYGWFVEAAQTRAMRALGVEPDVPVAEDAIRRGLNIRIGRFPDCLDASEKFDVLSFNDVLEHLWDIPAILEACRKHLSPEGLLVLTVPSSRGALFRVSHALRRLGVRHLTDRLWQRRFPCPHVHYFHAENLKRLLERHQFELLHGQDMPLYRLRGLWSRVRMDGNAGLLFSTAAWLGLAAIHPWLRLMPSDIILQIYGKRVT